MRRAALLALVAAFAAAPASAEPGDVPWYIERPAERRAMLARCRRDAALADTRECMNARTAGAADFMRRLGPPPKDLLLPDWRMPAPATPPPLPQPSPPPQRRTPPRAT